MSIHTFGDSHSYFGWDGIVPHHLGPILCYSFGKEKLNRCNIRNFNIKDGDTVIFCFGEIDCRCHIYKHITNAVSYEHLIDKIVNSYFEAIDLNIVASMVTFKNVCVYNIVPPVQRYNTAENPKFPYLGTDDERKKYVLYFNRKLKEKCTEREYIFFDVYDKYIDENGFLRKELSDGNVHINNGIFIRNFIKENGL